MTLKEARALRDEIQATGLYCTVPLGWGPERYFARIYSEREREDIRFQSREEWLAWKAAANRDGVLRWK